MAMRRLMKSVGWFVGGLLALLLVAILLVYGASTLKLNRTFTITPAPVAIPTGVEAIAKGEYLTRTRGCRSCHGENLAGTVLADDPMIGTLSAGNLTSGVGGVGQEYNDTDWVRAIRHGVRANGLSMIIMPSSEYWHYSDEDLGAIIAYIKSVPPVDTPPPPRAIGPLGRVLTLANAIPIQADLIDHNAPRPALIPRGATAAYGEYLAPLCYSCHGTSLAGGTIPGSDTATPTLTSGGLVGQWSQAEFIRTLQTGQTPEGRTLNSDMPWDIFGQMEEDELAALYLYLSTLPPAGRGSE